MGLLTPLTSAKCVWKWEELHMRAFQEIKDIIEKHRIHHQQPLDYSTDAGPINLVTNASLTGAGRVVSQGDNLEMARIAAFWSGKFNPAQQNYATHEQELLAVVKSLI